MPLQTDRTLKAYGSAATWLQVNGQAATLLQAMALTHSMARCDDDEANALPAIVIGIAARLKADKAANTQGVVTRCLQNTLKNRLRAAKSAGLCSLPEGYGERVPMHVAADRQAVCSPAEALGQIGQGSAKILQAIVTDTLQRQGKAMLKGQHSATVTGVALGDLVGTVTSAVFGPLPAEARAGQRAGAATTCATYDNHPNIVGAMPNATTKADGSHGERHAGRSTLPLRVGVIAAALGLPKPRAQADSDSLRRLACMAFARFAAAMNGQPCDLTDSAVQAAARAAFAYVTRSHSGSHGQAVWQAWARPDSVDPMSYKAFGFVPDMVGRWVEIAPTYDMGYGPTYIMPAIGPCQRHRVAAVTSYRQIKDVLPGVAYGAACEMSLGDLEHLAGPKAKAAGRAIERNDIAAAAYGLPCLRPVIVTATDKATRADCGCGAQAKRDLALLATSQGKAKPSDAGYRVTVWVHTLAPCPLPALVTKGDASAMLCRCGSHRGSLIESAGLWRHRAQR